MLRGRLKIILAVFVLVFLFTQKNYAKNEIRTIVMFFSWNASTPAYQNMLEGFHSAYSIEDDVSTHFLIEYLDLNRMQNETYTRNIVDLYNEKYKNTQIDLLVIVGPSAYPILKKYGLKALGNTPIISIENKKVDRDTTVYPSNLLKMELDYNFENTLKNAFKLFPNNKNVYVISGISPVDSYYIKRIKIAAKPFEENRSIIYFNNISIDSVKHFVEEIPRNSIVIVSAFSLDNNRIPFSYAEVISVFAKHSAVPVIPLVDTYIIKRGGLGGYLFSYINVGKEAGKAANQILNGKSIRDINVNNKQFYQYSYDWKELKRWGLQDSKLISPDSIIYYHHPSLLEQYKWYILAVIIFLISQSFFIVYLIKLNRRQKETARQRAQAEDIYRELVREDRLMKMVELTASLSHELNQPLTAILYNAQAGKRFLQSGNIDLKQTEEIFDYIIEDDKRAGAIISSVKSLMKLENREKENVNLTLMLQETLDIFNAEAIRNNVIINKSLQGNPVWVYGDKIQLQQVLLNFMRNALNAMEGNLPENRLIDIVQQVNKGTVTVSVHDSGPGIDPDIKEKMFKPFVTGNKKGFGIGLALSQSIIDKHNGEIWAANLPGGGAQFSFRLKIARDA